MIPTQPLSSYWLSDIDDLTRKYEDQDYRRSPEFALRLSQIRKGIANFVRIVTKRDIPVRFNINQQKSYAVHDGKNEYIVISATSNPELFDSNVGIALHEAAHLILSKPTADIPESIPLFHFLSVLKKEPITSFFPNDVYDLAQRIQLSDDDLGDLFKKMINWLEDRRIDAWMMDNAIGYQGYYRALYAAFWDHPDISTLLLDPSTHTSTLQNYRFHIINMTNPAADPRFLPELDVIWKLVDLPNISRFSFDNKWEKWKRKGKNGVYPIEKLPDVVQVAIRIIGIILNHCQPSVESSAQKEPVAMEYFDAEKSLIATTERSKIDEMQDKFLDNDIDKECVDKDVVDLLDALDGANAEMITVSDGPIKNAKVIVYHKLTMALINSVKFPFSRKLMGDAGLEAMILAINDGISMGDLLAYRLRVLSDEFPITYPRQESGMVDDRLLADLMMWGETHIFKMEMTRRHRPIVLHLSIDSSGSMYGLKWYNSIRLAVAMARGAEKVKNLEVIISFRTSSDLLAHVLIAYDSRQDKIDHIRKTFPYLGAAGGTPEGLCFAAIKRKIIDSNDQGSRRFFVNISDGEPGHVWHINNKKLEWYRGTLAWKHTAQQVKEMRQAGISILSYFIYQGKEPPELKLNAFKTMYGSSSVVINPTDVGSIARTLNRLFMSGL